VADVTNGISPLTVTFTNQSTGATSYLWNFGDGNTSSLSNLTHTYTNAGNYSVTLVASGAGGTNSLTLTNYVVVTNAPPPPVVADFAADQANGGAPLLVNFTNLSTGATNYLWDFGDGNSSTLLNPTNTYTNAGSYSVTLGATGPGGTNAITLTNYILVTNLPTPPVTADFTAGPTNGPTPLFVTFTNLSTGATNYEWAFGDGKLSTALNPTNTYTNAGTYSVTLLATGPGGTNELTLTNYIVVTNPPPPPVAANFVAAPTNGVAPLTVTFTNLSTGATNYLWDFGDGDQTVAPDPIHTYTNAGSYSVTLTAFTTTETNTLTRTNYIVVAAPPLLLVTPPGLDFGLVLTGATAQASFVVSNAGGTVLNGSASVASSAFILVSTNPFAVPPSASTNVAIEFMPASPGVFSNIVTFATDGGNATNMVTGRALFAPLLKVLAAEPTNFNFSFESFEGFTYTIEYKDDLTDPTWHTLSTNTGTGSSITYTNPVAAPPWRFYRLRVH
jgi:PKD repeat protein